MRDLLLALLLTQTPDVPPEHFQRFEAERAPVLAALWAKYSCDKPRKAPEPLCDVAQVEQRGTAADPRGKGIWVGVSWVVKRGKGGKAEVGAPRVVALALNRDSVGLWGAVTDLRPRSAEEGRQLTQLARDYEALLRGRKKEVTLPPHLRELLDVWSRSANHLAEKKGNAWVFRGTPSALRKVDERWVLLGVPKAGEGLAVAVFAP